LGIVDEKIAIKISRSGVEAARRKFTPEFMNRLDKIVTFHPLGSEQLKKILDIELNLVQQRIFNTSNDRAFVFTCSDSSKNFLLKEGTDLKYGARHLKRAIERLLVQPMSNLIATEQVRGGDWVFIDYDLNARSLRFAKEAEGLPVTDMAWLADHSMVVPDLVEETDAAGIRQSRAPRPTGAGRRSRPRHCLGVCAFLTFLSLPSQVHWLYAAGQRKAQPKHPDQLLFGRGPSA
jgi:hypothetical protein